MTGIQKTKLPSSASATDWYLIYSVFLMLVLCALGNLSNIVVSAFVLVLSLPLVLKAEYLLGIVLFSTVFDQYILFSAGQSFSRFYVLLFLLGAFLHFLPGLAKMRADMRFWYFAAFFLTGIFLSFYGVEGRTSFPVGFCLNLLLMLFMAYFIVLDTDALMTQLWIGCAIGSLYSLWMLTRDGLDVFETGRVTAFAGDVNANEVAMGLCVITITLFSHFFTQKKKLAVINAVLTGISVVSLFLTGSRSGLLGALAGMVLVVLVWMKQNGRNMLKGIVVCAAVSLLLVLIFVYMQEAFPTLMERFTVENVAESGGTGRVAVWEAYLTHYFPDYWAFGIGFDPLNIYFAVRRINGIGHGAHNALVDIISSSGVFGLSIYLGFLFHLFAKIAKRIKNDPKLLLVVGLIGGLLVNGIGENIIRGRFFWFSVGLSFILMNSEKRGDINEK